MEKQTYYVSVQSSSILTEQGATPYEFEIQATQEEVDKLQSLFDFKSEADQKTFYRAHIPAYPYHVDPDNDMYDSYLNRIYELIYKLGTDETKQAIRQSRLMQRLEGLGEP
ncbi:MULTISPECIES: hypothetical protein [unclassified Paenibacillus]|uniref:hypothetical protein n=1 Tax=unclassified Paenibacillus TaxID=185978 RepID=UPI001C11A367|nr:MULTISPECIES: hypothetical protein [unclassified Paenibacillus]MBU5441502.1 hypothetical protein [Paenibacillus sp. MSJ-34]CAH0118372.1 hypothetical protein PAE9249_00859 [Paenibacillus sp. CECT 9249]